MRIKRDSTDCILLLFAVAVVYLAFLFRVHWVWINRQACKRYKYARNFGKVVKRF